MNKIKTIFFFLFYLCFIADGQSQNNFSPIFYIYKGNVNNPTWTGGIEDYHNINENVCNSDIVTIMIYTAINLADGRTQTIRVEGYDCIWTSPRDVLCTTSPFSNINISGNNIISATSTILDGGIQTVIIKILAQKTSNYNISWSAKDSYNQYPSTDRIESFFNYSGQFTLNVIEKLQNPSIQFEEILHPSYADNSKTLKLNVSGCDGNNQITWLKGGGSGKSFIMNDPYDCEEYQVACTNSCDNTKSNIIIPSKNYHPQNSGYSQIYLNHIINKLNSSDIRGESMFRSQYLCILQSSKNTTWGNGFVKYNFDYVASHYQCTRTFELELSNNVANSTIWGFINLGQDHFTRELSPAFIQYFKNLNCGDISIWRNEHEQFLNNAVSPCFDNLIYNYTRFNPTETLALLAVRKTTLAMVRNLRENLIALHSSIFNCSPLALQNSTINNFNPLTLTKNDLFYEPLDNASIIKIKALSDTTFFLKTNSIIQLRALKTLSNGTTIDITNQLNSSNYKLSLDTTLAVISDNGLLKIKRTNLPYSYDRLPLIIRVEDNESNVGFGQFAIYDSDNDNDFLADTYEEKEGLNSNIPNPINIDTDKDGIEDFLELSFLTSPVKSDTDGDGYSDKIEMLKGTDANSSLSYPYPIFSIQSGSWNDSNSWSCNCVPSLDDAVIIKSGHMIELSNTMGAKECLKLETEQGAIFNCTGILKTFLK